MPAHTACIELQIGLRTWTWSEMLQLMRAVMVQDG